MKFIHHSFSAFLVVFMSIVSTLGCTNDGLTSTKRSQALSNLSTEESKSWLTEKENRQVKALDWGDYESVAEVADIAFLNLVKKSTEASNTDFEIPEWLGVLQKFELSVKKAIKAKRLLSDSQDLENQKETFVALQTNKSDSRVQISIAESSSLDQCENDLRKDALRLDVSKFNSTHKLSYMNFWTIVIFWTSAIDGCFPKSQSELLKIRLQVLKEIEEKISKNYFIIPSHKKPIVSNRSLMLARGVLMTPVGLTSSPQMADDFLMPPFRFLLHDYLHGDGMYQKDVPNFKAFPKFSDTPLTYNKGDHDSFVSRVKTRFEFVKTIIETCKNESELSNVTFWMQDTGYSLEDALLKARSGDHFGIAVWMSVIQSAAEKEGLL